MNARMRQSGGIIVLVAALGATAFPAPAHTFGAPTTPATAPANRAGQAVETNAWLDRSVAYLELGLPTPPARRVIGDIELGLAITRMRALAADGGAPPGSRERDFPLLRRLLAAPPPSRPARTSPQAWDFFTRLASADLLAALGETNKTRAELAELERLSMGGGEQLGLPYLSADYFLARGYASLGDLDKVLELIATDLSIDSDFAYGSLIVAFHDANQPAARDSLLKLRARQVELIADPRDRAASMRALARAQLQTGDLSAARRTVASMPDLADRTDAHREIAVWAVANVDDAKAAQEELVEAMRAGDRFRSRRAEDAARTARTAAELGATDLARAAIASAEARAAEDGTWDYTLWGELALASAAVLDADPAADVQRDPTFDRLIQRAVENADAQADPRSQARALLLVAAAHARRGDRHAAQTALERSVATSAQADYGAVREFNELSLAHVRAGNGEVALRDAGRLVRDEASLARIHDAIAQHDARGGRFDAAWAAASKITGDTDARLAAWCRVGITQAKSAASPAAVTAAIEAHVSDPRDRATIALAIAQSLLGPGHDGPIRALPGAAVP